MSWPPPDIERRHVVAVEDHLYHTAEFLDAIARLAPGLLPLTTVCAIDDPGPDTTAAVSGWLERYPGIQVVARVDPRSLPPAQAKRVGSLAAAQLAEVTAFAKALAALVSPGGILIQDIHLSTLPCVPADRWWESIYVAATVRGMFPRRQPAVRFVSNKRGYTATFGRDLLDAGFDPREVMDKAELDQVIVPSVAKDVETRFPLELSTAGERPPFPVGADDESRREIEERLDLVEWNTAGRVELGGRLLAGPVTFRPGSNEGLTWQQLIADRMSGGSGISILEVGERLADAGAERAEMSNLAARHIHALRGRLSNPAAIVTAKGAYRLDDAVAVGRVTRRGGHLR